MVLAGEFASPAQERRFRLEAESAGRVQHPNIVQVYEIGSYQGHPFLATEWVEGELGRSSGPEPWPPGGGLVPRDPRPCHPRGTLRTGHPP